jgi:hypothetical protein
LDEIAKYNEYGIWSWVCDKNVGKFAKSLFLPYNLFAYKQTDYREALMNKTLVALKVQRSNIYKKFEKLGNFRRGSLTLNYRKCGKKNCICTSKGHPGHGPQYLWSITLKGKSYAKKLELGAELQKYKEEISNYRDYKKLCDEIIQVNEAICNLEPIPAVENKNELEELKKKLQNLFKKKYKKK